MYLYDDGSRGVDGQAGSGVQRGEHRKDAMRVSMGFGGLHKTETRLLPESGVKKSIRAAPAAVVPASSCHRSAVNSAFGG